MDIASVTSYPINHFKELEIRGKLNLQPAVQRNLVWSDNQSIYLIDTLMKNLPLALLFAETIIDANQDTIWNIIDGQQRLTSLMIAFSECSLQAFICPSIITATSS